MRIEPFVHRHWRRHSRGLRAAVIILDLLVLAFAAAGTYALLTDGSVFRITGMRVSLQTSWRPYVWAAAILLLRCRLVAQPGSLLRRAEASIARRARRPFVFDERALFREGGSWRRETTRFAVLVLGFVGLVAVLTWPQVQQLHSVPDYGDPLLSIWKISWVNRQLFRDPSHLFDGNMFHPEPLTLTYSDPVIVPALMAAPLFWMHLHKVVIYNLLFLSGFVLSGVTMFILVRALTNRIEAAAVAGVIFAVYPYRLEHYSHLELQMTMWMPLALWGLHRTLVRARWRDGLVTGLAFALQCLSSLYYGSFLAVYVTVVGGALWLGRGRPLRPIGPLVAGALVAGAVAAPVAMQYVASRRTIGERSDSEVRFYSAEPRDYLTPHARSLVYGRWADPGHPERRLFPGLMPLALTAVAVWPPLSVPRIAYTLGLVVAIDGSLGYNGVTFTWLREHLSPFRSIRVPARFSILAGLSLAILAGYGATGLLERWSRHRRLLTAGMMTLVIVEAVPTLTLREVWRAPPAIYARFDGRPPSVLAEFPMPPGPLSSPADSRYLYFSTFHWQRIVNGSSGFLPRSYLELLERERDFPSDASLEYLRRRGVQYLAIHEAFYEGLRYRDVRKVLDARSDVEQVISARWENGESTLYRLR